MASVTLKNLKKIYPVSAEEYSSNEDDVKERASNLEIVDEGVVAVQDFSIDIADGEFIVLVGPSGCGKSTTLRMIAGLEEITEGELYIDGKLVNDVPPKGRDVSMVFQNYALFPHLTVHENIAFPLSLRHVPKKEIDRRVREAAEILGVTPYLKRKPKALSGGQRQRVAIGRSLVREPKVMLMDEPLSNLDAKLRNEMRSEILKLRKRIKSTFVYVTHDQTEAMTLGDRIVIMRDGYVQQIGTPRDVFSHPANLFVAGFIGMPVMNFFDARLEREDEAYYISLGTFRTRLSYDKEERLLLNNVQSCDITLGVRPEHCFISEDGHGIDGCVELNEMMGASTHLHVSALGKDVIIVVPTAEASSEYNSGDTVKIAFKGSNAHVFSKDSGINLEYLTAVNSDTI